MEKTVLKKFNYKHLIAILITISFVIISITVFKSSYIRFYESLRDLWASIKYYFSELFNLNSNVVPTVNDTSTIKWTPIFNLPATWEEFKVSWSRYWQIWANGQNFQAYFIYLGNLVYKVSKILLLIVTPLILLFYLLFQRYLSKQNNDYNKDSKALIVFKKISERTYIPVKYWIKDFTQFCSENKYFKVWLWLWLFNFNVITIVIEFLAFYFYFVISFDLKNLYKQFYKLFCDLSVPVAFIPLWCWLILGYLLLCKIRQSIGYKRLTHFERMNCGFINERPIVMMICGTMGRRKTTMLTDISLSQEAMFRDKAFDLLSKNDMKFPNFPWINLENTIKYEMHRHIIYNLATCKKFIKHLECCFCYSFILDKQSIKSVKRHLKTKFNVNYDNFIFDYDFSKYGLDYNDNLTIEPIWNVLSTYAQLYFIYVIQSSLCLSNYSIRTDNILSECGNFPQWDTDFFKRPVELQNSTSHYAHIIDFDALRLGRKVVEDNFKANSFEFGVVNITEVGKERKNNLQLQETKKKDDLTNQKNDGFNDWLKMVRHSATVDNFPFVKVICDEQRPESWGADARDLTEIVHIKSCGDWSLAMPFFNIFSLVYNFVYSKFMGLYYKYRFIRSDNTLPMYLLKKLCSLMHNRYTKIDNTFGFSVLNLQVESGTQDGQFDEKKYYLMKKKIYSRRFSTDCFSDYFVEKSLKSKIGIDDLKTYETVKANFDELKMQNSYFINDLIERKNINEKD